MTLQALPTEALDIDAEQRGILLDLRSGDFTKQRLACDRLSALAENHFQTFLPTAIALISDANRLDDRIRERTISMNEQGVEIRQLIEATVNLLSKMTSTEPVGRIKIDQLSAEDRRLIDNQTRVTSDVTAGQGSSEPKQPPDAEDNDENLDLTRWIVRAQEPKTQGKLIITQDLTKVYAASQFRLRPISLELGRGEILGIVGVNASGKTTLLACTRFG